MRPSVRNRRNNFFIAVCIVGLAIFGGLVNVFTAHNSPSSILLQPIGAGTSPAPERPEACTSASWSICGANAYIDARLNADRDLLKSHELRVKSSTAAVMTDELVSVPHVAGTRAELRGSSLGSQVDWYAAYGLPQDESAGPVKLGLDGTQTVMGLGAKVDRTAGTVDIWFDTAAFRAVAVYGTFTRPTYPAGPPIPEQQPLLEW